MAGFEENTDNSHFFQMQ